MLTCNKLTWLKRKNSGLYEAQLNLKLLKAINLYPDLNVESIISNYGFTKIPALLAGKQKADRPAEVQPDHTSKKSRGSAREWPLEHFATLINLLPENRFHRYRACNPKRKE